MQFLDKYGLGTFLAQLKNIFGYKAYLDEAKAVLDETTSIRQQHLLEIDYERYLAFDTNSIINDIST